MPDPVIPADVPFTLAASLAACNNTSVGVLVLTELGWIGGAR